MKQTKTCCCSKLLFAVVSLRSHWRTGCFGDGGCGDMQSSLYSVVAGVCVNETCGRSDRVTTRRIDGLCPRVTATSPCHHI